MRSRTTNTSNFPVMKKHCSTCPFKLTKDGVEQDGEIANRVRSRSMQVSQICHHPRLSGKKETHLCRGARDYQLDIMHKVGFLKEPTDECWDAQRKLLGV